MLLRLALLLFTFENCVGTCLAAWIDFLRFPLYPQQRHSLLWRFIRAVLSICCVDPSEKSWQPEVNDRARVSLLPRAEPGHSCSAYPSFYFWLGPGRWLSPRREEGSIHIIFALWNTHSSHNRGFFDAAALALVLGPKQTNSYCPVKFDRRLPAGSSWRGFGRSVRFLWKLVVLNEEFGY